MFVTVTEKWNGDCGDEARVLVHFKLDEMLDQGKFTINELTNNRSVYNTDGSPTKIFTSVESANEYIAFCSNLNPVSMAIRQFDTKELLYAFIATVSDESHVPAPGPSPADHERFRKLQT